MQQNQSNMSKKTALVAGSLLAIGVKSADGVKGTKWTDAKPPSLLSDGCELPQVDYDSAVSIDGGTLPQVIAPGFGSDLGDLAIVNGSVRNCGQVYKIQCQATNGGAGYGDLLTPTYAVVSSQCPDEGCGIDMQLDTWNSATENSPSGITSCNIELSNKNPLPGDNYQCFHRNGSDLNNAWYASVGIFNTQGQIIESIKIDDTVGSANGTCSVYFDVDSPPVGFVRSSSIVSFKFFGDDTWNKVEYSTCKDYQGNLISDDSADALRL